MTLCNLVVAAAAVIFRAEDASTLSPYDEVNTTRWHFIISQEKIMFIFEFY
jgi:hypothetical protein